VLVYPRTAFPAADREFPKSRQRRDSESSDRASWKMQPLIASAISMPKAPVPTAPNQFHL
jgi:hypothetical protein